MEKSARERFLSYHSNWESLEGMLERITAPEFRAAHADPQGNACF